MNGLKENHNGSFHSFEHRSYTFTVVLLGTSRTAVPCFEKPTCSSLSLLFFLSTQVLLSNQNAFQFTNIWFDIHTMNNWVICSSTFSQVISIGLISSDILNVGKISIIYRSINWLQKSMCNPIKKFRYETRYKNVIWFQVKHIVVDRKIEFDSVLADIAIDIYRLPAVCAEAERIKRAPKDWPFELEMAGVWRRRRTSFSTRDG